MEDEKIVYVSLGWLLAILGQAAFASIQKEYRRRDVRMLIFSELRDTALRLGIAIHRIHSHLGLVDKKTLEWRTYIYKK